MEDGVTGGIETATHVGARLAAARAALGLSLEDIAERTRVPKRHLMTIEANSVEGLPAIPYTVGFVRSYARAVGIDAELAAQEFRARLNAVPDTRYQAPAPYEPADPARVPPRWLALVALGLAVLLAVGYAVWRGDGLFGGGADDRARLAATTSDAPPAPDMVASPAMAPSAPAAATGGLVSLTATESVWVRIYEMNGPTLFQGEMTPGQRFEVPAAAVDPRIRTARAQAIMVRIGERVVAPVGPPDRTLSDVPVNAAALAARPAAPGSAPMRPLVPEGASGNAATPATGA